MASEAHCPECGCRFSVSKETLEAVSLPVVCCPSCTVDLSIPGNGSAREERRTPQIVPVRQAETWDDDFFLLGAVSLFDDFL